MPEEQFIDQQVPEPLKKVRPIPSFEEYAPEAAFGGGKEGFAEASRKTFSDIGEMQKAHEKDANESRITQLLAQAQMGMDDILKPALKRAPQDALDVKEKETSPLNLIQKKFDEVIEQSSNDDQRKFLQGALSTLKAKANESLDEYAAEQSKVLAVQSENANNKASLVSAITSPKQYDFYRNLVKTGTKYGDPNKALENFDYTFAMSRVNAGDLDTAEKILPGLSATNLKTLAKTIDGDRATQLGQKLFDEHGDKALEKASEIENPEQRKLATNEIKRQQAAKESQEKFSKDQGLIRLTEYAASHPGQDVSLLDKTTWYNLSQSQPWERRNPIRKSLASGRRSRLTPKDFQD